MNFSAIGNINSLFAGDWLLALIFLVAAFVYGLSMGRNRLVIVMLGVYFSYILTRAIPWKELSFIGVKETPGSTVQIFVFLALVVGFYFLLPHSAFRAVVKLQGRRRTSWWQVLILGILQIGLILELVVTFLPAKNVAALSPLAQTIFIGPLVQFLWLLLPILVLMFLRTRQYEVGG
jgi:hypothetical protein